MSGLFGGDPPANLGPVVTGVQVSTSCYGKPVPLVYGTIRVSPNNIWMPSGDPWFKALDVETQGGGGKGGGNTPTQKEYHQAVALAICEGPVGGYGRVWRDKDVFNALSDMDKGTFTAFTGTRPQTAWSFFITPASNRKTITVDLSGTNKVVYIADPGFVSVLGVTVATGIGRNRRTSAQKFQATPATTAGKYSVSGNAVQIGGTYSTNSKASISYQANQANGPFAIPYGGTGYIITSDLNLGNSNSMKNITVEVYGFYSAGPNSDVNPADVIQHFITDATVGCGLPPGSIITDVGQDGTAASSYRTYCQAMGFNISWNCADQKSAADHVKEILEATNSDWFEDSAGVLHVVPLGDTQIIANGVTFTPVTTPVIDILSDDYQAEGEEDRVSIATVSQQATYNSFSIEYLNRHAVDQWLPSTQYNYGDLASNGNQTYECVLPGISAGSGGPTGKDGKNVVGDGTVGWLWITQTDINAYAVSVANFVDQANVNRTGKLRAASASPLHCITNPDHALIIARLKTQRSLYVTRTYTFQVGWKHSFLEPFDLITISDDLLGLDRRPVRIKSIEEDGDSERLTITAEDALIGVASAAAYKTEEGEGGGQHTSGHPATANPPAIFCPPLYATQNGTPELWIGTSGASVNWGGSQVWLSWDGGDSYSYLGDTGACVYGVLAADLSSGASLDTSSVLTADVRQSDGTLLSVSDADRDAMISTCLLDSEIVSFSTASLVSAGIYNLTQLRRGLLGTLPAPHPAGSVFVKLDGPFLRVQIDPSRYGTVATVKLVSFNLSRTFVEDSATAPVFDYQLPPPPASREKGGIPLRFTMDNDFILNEWEITGSGVPTIVTGGLDGGNMLEVVGPFVALHRTLIPISSDTLYGLSAQWKQKQEPTNGQKNLKVGLVGIAGDGVTPVDLSGAANLTTNQHTVGPFTATVGASWQQSNGYWQGWASPGTVGGTLAAPGHFHASVRYLRVAVWMNDAAGDGIQDLDYIEVYDALSQQANAGLATKNNPPFYESSAPASSGTRSDGGPTPYVLVIGDLWFNTASNYAPFRWSGTQWLSVHDASPIVASQVSTGLITADMLNVNDINSAATLRINAATQITGSLAVGQVSGLGALATKNSVANADITSIDGGKITTGTITAQISVTSANMIINGTSFADIFQGAEVVRFGRVVTSTNGNAGMTINGTYVTYPGGNGLQDGEETAEAAVGQDCYVSVTRRNIFWQDVGLTHGNVFKLRVNGVADHTNNYFLLLTHYGYASSGTVNCRPVHARWDTDGALITYFDGGNNQRNVTDSLFNAGFNFLIIGL